MRVELVVPARMRDGTIQRPDVAWPVPKDGPAATFPVLLRRTPYKKTAPSRVTLPIVG